MIVTSVNPKMSNGPYWSNASDRVSDDDRAKNSSDEDDEEEDEIEEEADDRGNKRVQLSTLQDARIRVGRDYQATATPHIPPEERKEDDSTERELLVWSPSSDANWEEVDEFLTVAKDKYGYSIEQALGLLLWRKHSIESAKEALAEFSPLPDEWSPQDKLLFETAFEFHGKHFKRLQQMLPDKTIASLVKYYYSWKKSRLRVSYIDKEMEKLVGRGSTDPAVKQSLDLLKVVSSEENTEQRKRGRTHRGLSRETVGFEFSASFQAGKDEDKVDETSCMNCWININIPHQTPFGSLCASCYKHWWVTGNHRPLGTNEKEENGESKMKVEVPGNSSDVKTRIPLRPPPGIYINHDDLLTIGNQKFEENLDTLKKLDEKIRLLREKAQKQKQWLAMNDHKLQLKDSEFFDLQAMLEVEGLDDKDERDSEQTEDNVDSDGGNGSSNNGSTSGNNGSNGKKEEVETNSGRTLRARQRWTKNDRLVLIEGFKRFGMNLSRIASLLPNRSERDLLYFLNNAQANGYSSIMINAVKSYESLHGSIPGSDKLRSLILGRWSLPLSGSSTPKSKGSPKPTVKSVV